MILRLYISGTHQHPDITVSSPIQTGSLVFVEQVLPIYCTSIGSQVLLWESQEYIGRHKQVSVTSERIINGGVTSGNVSIIDIKNNGSGEQTQISSKLSLVVLPNYKAFTIKCRNGDHGEIKDNVTYHLSGMH